MGLSAVAATDQTRSGGDTAQMVGIAQTSRFAHGQGGLVNPAIWTGSCALLPQVDRTSASPALFHGQDLGVSVDGFLVSAVALASELPAFAGTGDLVQLSLMFVFRFDGRCFPGRRFISRHRHTVTVRRHCQTSSGPAWWHRSLHPWPPFHGPGLAKLNGLHRRLSLRAR